ncbi:MAG: NAD(P)/FAD-dependent oxidoreductase [Catonella sp.]|uniref:NAD(P)/FAD-dependent oxidoreductase n=1 Tax=Catonella sp. TaxID=2382125 RepID=UPI003F9FDB47
MKRYDIAIVGTGPGGLEAAITAKLRNKDILLFGNKELSLKITKALDIKNYLGLPDITGRELADAYKNHLKKMDVDINYSRINAVYAMGDYFVLQSAEEIFEAKSVILATGVVTGKTMPGENENLGSGVSYCATCDAALYKGKEAVVVGYAPKEEEEVVFLAERATKVTYIALYKNVPFLADNVEIIEGESPKEIVKDGERITLVTNKSNYKTDGIFILRDAVSPDKLVPGLNIEDGHIVTDRSMRTNIEGLFACGDVTGKPYQYIKAAGEGNVAALSAVSYLAGKVS